MRSSEEQGAGHENDAWPVSLEAFADRSRHFLPFRMAVALITKGIVQVDALQILGFLQRWNLQMAWVQPEVRGVEDGAEIALKEEHCGAWNMMRVNEVHLNL